MPYRKVHSDTGFVEFIRTPEEKKMVQLEVENSELKKKLGSIEEVLKDKFGIDLSQN